MRQCHRRRPPIAVALPSAERKRCASMARTQTIGANMSRIDRVAKIRPPKTRALIRAARSQVARTPIEATVRRYKMHNKYSTNQNWNKKNQTNHTKKRLTTLLIWSRERKSTGYENIKILINSIPVEIPLIFSAWRPRPFLDVSAVDFVICILVTCVEFSVVYWWCFS